MTILKTSQQRDFIKIFKEEKEPLWRIIIKTKIPKSSNEYFDLYEDKVLINTKELKKLCEELRKNAGARELKLNFIKNDPSLKIFISEKDSKIEIKTEIHCTYSRRFASNWSRDEYIYLFRNSKATVSEKEVFEKKELEKFIHKIEKENTENQTTDIFSKESTKGCPLIFDYDFEKYSVKNILDFLKQEGREVTYSGKKNLSNPIAFQVKNSGIFIRFPQDWLLEELENKKEILVWKNNQEVFVWLNKFVTFYEKNENLYEKDKELFLAMKEKFEKEENKNTIKKIKDSKWLKILNDSDNYNPNEQ